MATKGYIKIWRKVWDDPIFDSRRTFSKFEAWVDLIMLAAGKDKDVIFDANLISLKRGQVLTSQNRLSKRWGWSRNKVKKFLFLLMSEDHPKIGLKIDRKKSIITVINYNKYNPIGTTERQLKDNRKTTEGQHLIKDIKKDIKKEKKKEKKKASKDTFSLRNRINNIQFRWNEFARKYNLPVIISVKPGSNRERHLKARLAEKEFNFDLLLDVIENSPFLMGKTKHAFFIFFDWIIKSTNYQKIMEGNYLDRQGYQKFSGIVEGIKELEEKYRKGGRK